MIIESREKVTSGATRITKIMSRGRIPSMSPFPQISFGPNGVSFSILLVLTLAFSALATATPPSGVAPQASVIEHSNPRFKFTLPAGYVRMEFPRGTPPEMVYGFTRQMGGGKGDGMVLTMRVLPLTIEQGYIKTHFAEYEKDAGSYPQSKMVVTDGRWDGENLEVLEHRYAKDEPRLMLTTIVPLFTKSLEINFAGSQNYEGELQSDLRSLLYKFEAPNGWRIRRQSEMARYAGLPAAVGLCLAPAYLIAWVISFRKSATRAHMFRMAWLSIIAMCFASSFMMGFVVGADFVNAFGPALCSPWGGGVLTLLATVFLVLRVVRFSRAKRSSSTLPTAT